MGPDGVMKDMQFLNDYFAPGATDSVYQGVARPLRPGRAIQTTGEYLVRLDLLRRKAESKMAMGGAGPDTFASAICLQNASPPRPE